MKKHPIVICTKHTVKIYIRPFVFSLMILLIFLPIYGQSWKVLHEDSTDHFLDVFFVDNSHGWVVGTEGLILHTTDGGYAWHDHSIETSAILTSIHFPSMDKGWIVTANRTILHTSDAGSTWVTQESEVPHALWEVFFVNDSVGWAVGAGTSKGVILKTVDAGLNWSTVGADLSGGFMSVYFISEHEGWVVGGKSLGFPGDPIIWHTEDGGVTWEEQESPSYYYAPLLKVRFWDEETGWAVGMDEGALRTIDGGETWEIVDVLGDGFSCCFHDVGMASSSNIWLQNIGYICHSVDGGQTWEVEWEWNYPTILIFPGMFIADSIHGWAVGGSMIIGYSNETISTWEVENMELPIQVLLDNIFPNPFNPTTTIEFSIPKSGTVTLTIYDVLGRQVETILNKHMEAGHHKVQWNASHVPSGIYFVRMQTRDPSTGSGHGFSQVRKVMILK